MEQNKKLKVKCPKCSLEFLYYSSESRPFCSERCKMVDMGQWFEEAYTIKGPSHDPYIEQVEEDEY